MVAPVNDQRETSLRSGFRFDGLNVDPNAGIVAGPGGSETLDPKVMSVLVVLAQNAGQVVRREDLLSLLWPNAAVTDDALSQCIYKLRKQLARAGGNDKIKEVIESLPKRGYRLRGEITPLLLEAGQLRRNWRPAAIVTAVAILAAILAGLLGRTLGCSPVARAESGTTKDAVPRH